MNFSFVAADIFRGSERVLTNFSWHWEEGQQWLLTGPLGSGKTTIAEALMGHCRTRPGTLSFYDNEEQVSIYQVKPHIHYLGFTEDTHKLRFGDVFYYQQRYQAMESDAGLTVREYLFGKAKEAVVPPKLEPLNVEPLLDRRFIQLSNGQTRRVRLAGSLLKHPRLLILEAIFTGIDKHTTGIIEAMLRQQIESGTSVLLIGQEAPEFITHVLELSGGSGQKVWSRTKWLEAQRVGEKPLNGSSPLPESFLSAPKDDPDWDFEYAVRFDAVDISYQQKKIITGLDWEVRKGQKWMLSGPNGSGKSSIISLIFADNPQAYAQGVILFDRKRGTGESIWDIKRKIGFISPELQTYMKSRRNAVDIAAAGYTNTMVLSRKLKTDEIDRLRQLFDYFSIRHLAKKCFMDLSSGQQRLVLFIRAVINNPSLLVLDEPFHAMDEVSRHRCLVFLKEYCHPDRTLIYVSHLQEAPPAFITNELQL
jgi:molybdate transport system ATP-binding protein